MGGALHQRHEAPQARRIIPADAGSTLVQAVGGWQTADHPRGCGEHLLVSGPSGCPWGSSPRMRGAPLVGQHGHVLVRIIPADAGSTPSKRRSAASAPDHPRGCGEHIEPTPETIDVRGSSPRMRGALRIAHAQVVAARIIPADAGSTQRGFVSRNRFADHPRGCGEHVYPVDNFLGSQGSSPRMRGALLGHLHSRVYRRIIPADAGSTYPPSRVFTRIRDHPRGCGEH